MRRKTKTILGMITVITGGVVAFRRLKSYFKAKRGVANLFAAAVCTLLCTSCSTTNGIIFTMDGMSFAGGKIDKGLSLVNVMQLIDRYRDLYPGRAMFQEAKDIDSCWGNSNIPQPNSTSFTDTNSLLPQSFLSSVAFNDDSAAAASGDPGIASRIIDAAVELVLQPNVSPTPSVGGGSGNSRDDDDDEKKRKSKNKNQPTQRIGRRR